MDDQTTAAFSGRISPEILSRAESVKITPKSIQIKLMKGAQKPGADADRLRALSAMVSSAIETHDNFRWNIGNKACLKGLCRGVPCGHRHFGKRLSNNWRKFLRIGSQQEHSIPKIGTDKCIVTDATNNFITARELDDYASQRSRAELAADGVHEMSSWQPNELLGDDESIFQTGLALSAQWQDQHVAQVSPVATAELPSPYRQCSWEVSGISNSSSSTESSSVARTPERQLSELESCLFSTLIASWRSGSPEEDLTAMGSEVIVNPTGLSPKAKQGRPDLKLLTIPITLSEGPLTESPTEIDSEKPPLLMPLCAPLESQSAKQHQCQLEANASLHQPRAASIPHNITSSRAEQLSCHAPSTDQPSDSECHYPPGSHSDDANVLLEVIRTMLRTHSGHGVEVIVEAVENAFAAIVEHTLHRLYAEPRHMRELISSILPEPPSLDAALTSLTAFFDETLTCTSTQRAILSFFSCAVILIVADEEQLERSLRALCLDAVLWANDITTPEEKTAYLLLLRHIWKSTSELERLNLMTESSYNHVTAWLPEASTYKPYLLPHVCQSFFRREYEYLQQGTFSNVLAVICEADNVGDASLDDGKRTLDDPIQPPSLTQYIQALVVEPLLAAGDPELQHLATVASQVSQDGSFASFDSIEAQVSQQPGSDCYCLQTPATQSFVERCREAAGSYGNHALCYFKGLLLRRAHAVVSDPTESSSESRFYAGVPNVSDRPHRAQTTAWEWLGASDGVDEIMADTFDDHSGSEKAPLLARPRKQSRKPTLRRRTAPGDWASQRCEICGFETASKWAKDHVRRHIREKHSGTTFKCGFCSKRYTRNNARNAHQRKVHSICF